jgi:hypothetical protein
MEYRPGSAGIRVDEFDFNENSIAFMEALEGGRRSSAKALAG